MEILRIILHIRILNTHKLTCSMSKACTKRRTFPTIAFMSQDGNFRIVLCEVLCDCEAFIR